MRIILVDISAFGPASPAASILWITPDSCGISLSLLNLFALLLLVVFKRCFWGKETGTPRVFAYISDILIPVRTRPSCFRTPGLELRSADQSPSCNLTPRLVPGLWGPSQVAWSQCVAVGRGHPLLLWLCQGVGEPLGLGERRERRPADGEQRLQSLPSVLGTRSLRLLLPSPSSKYVT